MQNHLSMSVSDHTPWIRHSELPPPAVTVDVVTSIVSGRAYTPADALVVIWRR
jgi:hypothetical protein